MLCRRPSAGKHGAQHEPERLLGHIRRQGGRSSRLLPDGSGAGAPRHTAGSCRRTEQRIREGHRANRPARTNVPPPRRSVPTGKAKQDATPARTNVPPPRRSVPADPCCRECPSVPGSSPRAPPASQASLARGWSPHLCRVPRRRRVPRRVHAHCTACVVRLRTGDRMHHHPSHQHQNAPALELLGS